MYLSAGERKKLELLRLILEKKKLWILDEPYNHLDDLSIEILNQTFVDHSNNNQAVFESGAILIYLSERSGKFYDKENKLNIDQWLMAQMGLVGPMIGQYHYFYRFNKGLSEVGEKRYFEMTKSIYEVLEDHLSKNKYLAGENYSIADIATWPWIARHEWHDIGLKKYQNLSRWYSEISEREAVIKGYAFMDENAVIPKP